MNATAMVPPVLDVAANLTRERGAQSARCLEQVLGQHLRGPEDGHEARVAVPAGDDVEMNVVLDSGSGDPADVPAEVEPVRPILAPERVDRMRREPVDLERLRVRERAE